jgi:hypothetical protein
VLDRWLKFVEELSLQDSLKPPEMVRAAWVELYNFFVEVNYQRPVFTKFEALPQEEKNLGVF